jgi:ABC-type polysaccharide/polyol phosphate transport system ATPase subunit
MGVNAIDVKNVSINYKILNTISIRNSLFKKREKDVTFEAIKNVSFSV